MNRSLSDITSELTELVRAECERNQIPGAAVGVVHKGEGLFICQGVTNLDDPQDITEATLFYIGSTSKTLCATAVMALVGQGRLSLDDKVIDHLPDLETADPEVAKQLSVGQLLDHSSGFLGDLTSNG